MTLQINTTTGQRALTADEQTEVREGIGAQSAAQVTATATTAATTAASAVVAAHAAATDPHSGQYAPAAHTHALLMTQPERDKLTGVAAGATANATDADLRDRATHTGTQPLASVDGLQAALDGKAPSAHTHTATDVGAAPAAHTHTVTDVIGLDVALAGKATAAQGAKADTALQSGALPVGTTLPAAQIGDAGAAGRDILRMATLAEIQSSVSKDRGFGPTIFDGIPVASGACNYPDSMYTTVVSGSTVRRWIANRLSAGVRLAWTTTVNTGAPAIVQPLLISGSVQLDNGATDRVRATIRGSDRAYVGANDVIVTDMCPVTTKAGQGLWSFTYSAGPHQPYKGQNLSVAVWYEGNNHAVGSAGIDATPQGGGSVVNASGGYSPIAVIGTYESAAGLPYVWCNGDSNTSGTGDYNADQNALASPYGKGWASRLFGPLNIPYLNTSYDGRQAGVNQAYQRQYGIGATDVINGLCINDVSSNVGNQSATVVKTRLLTLWREQQATLNPLTHLWQITCVPNTSSTDAWATLANQTVLASEPHRLEVNNWLRDGAPMNPNGTAAAIGATGVLRAGRLVSGSFAPGDAAHPIYGIIDFSPALEDQATGKWLVGKVYAGDNLGIHANYAGHQAWADAAAWIIPLLQKR